MRRRLVLLAMFLLFGAIVNIAVAWGCATWSQVTTGGSRIQNDADRERLDNESAVGAEDHVSLSSGFGFSHEGIFLQDSSDWNALVRAWKARGVTNGSYMSVPALFERRFVGWPCFALVGERWFYPLDRFEQVAIQPPSFSQRVPLRRSLEVPLTLAHRGFDGVPDPLPIGLIWPGFAINTLFYAAVLWLLFMAPFALRRWRRIKRGLCPACAYPVGTSDLCTECGKPVSSKQP